MIVADIVVEIGWADLAPVVCNKAREGTDAQQIFVIVQIPVCPQSDGVGDDRRVGALIVGNGIPQTIGIQVMLDDPFATPARGAAGEIRLAVAVGVKGCLFTC